MAVATSAVVAATLAIYAVLDLRGGATSRSRDLRRHIEDVALTMRYQMEDSEARLAEVRATTGVKTLTHAELPLRVEVVPATETTPTDSASPSQSRLKAFTEGRSNFLFTKSDDRLLYALPIRGAPDPLGNFDILGALEVSVDARTLEASFRADLWRTLPVLFGIVITVFLAIFYLSRSLVTAPISKLLTGVDDVAHGDLSRVLLAEREDEIGDLAARFNEMTFSLRESRSETKRHTETRTALEQKLFQTEKLATIGQIAAEIAHEVGTPLNVISGRAKGMLKKTSDPEAIEKNANIIAEQTARITRIIQRLLDFSRRKVGEEENQLVNLNLLTLNTMEFLESKLAAANVKHTLNRAEALPSIKGNPDHVLQILINLVLNAAEAMSTTGGDLHVETAEVTRRRPGLEVAPEMPTVVVSVSDTGPGIPEDERDKIFEPFYSSKTSSGGTGLGLAVVHGIVKEHDGWLEYSESPGGGSCFSVYFPAAEK
jgi:signal transduction histidine kinase